MSELLIQTSATAEWLSLVTEAESAAELHLDEDMQSYLVFLLMRFTERPELAGSGSAGRPAGKTVAPRRHPLNVIGTCVIGSGA